MPGPNGQPPHRIQPSPSPAQWYVQKVKAQADNGQAIDAYALSFFTVTGTCTTFWSREELADMAHKLAQMATGLTIAHDLPQ